MDYEQKYKDLVKAVKALQEANPSDEGIQNWVNENVPELAESENERIMREIAEFIYNTAFKPKDIKKKEKWLTWLEKQGKSGKEVSDKIESELVWEDKLGKKIERLKSQSIVSAEAKEFLYGKPAWSEEDENVLYDIEEAIINYWHGDTQDILLHWLKSLKQRIGG